MKVNWRRGVNGIGFSKIKAYYQQIPKLLEHGYFEYSFITVAFRNAIQMLELVLRIYYNKHASNVKPNISLRQLIDWFASNRFINQDQEKQLQILRDLRNEYSHPSKNSIITLHYVGIVDTILKITNHLNC